MDSSRRASSVPAGEACADEDSSQSWEDQRQASEPMAFPVPDEYEDEATLTGIEPVYREMWAFPISAGASLLAIMNIVANVPDPNWAVASLFPAGVQLALATLTGFFAVSSSGVVHRTALRRRSLREARAKAVSEGKDSARIEGLLAGKNRQDHAVASTWTAIFGLASGCLLLAAYITLAVGYETGGTVQAPHQNRGALAHSP